MMLDDLFSHGTMPVLERVIEFTEQRQEVLAHNIANIDTPFYRAQDLDTEGFQEMLAEAIDRRREGLRRPTEFRSTASLEIDAGGHVRAVAAPVPNNNVLFHDQNNRSVERLMAELARNQIQHNTAFRLLRSQMQTLLAAIRGRL